MFAAEVGGVMVEGDRTLVVLTTARADGATVVTRLDRGQAVALAQALIDAAAEPPIVMDGS